MEIAHDAAIAVAAGAHGFQQRLAVGVEQAEAAAFQLLAAAGDLGGVAAGILHVIKPAGRHAPVEDFRGYEALVGIRTFIQAETDVRRQCGKQF